MRSNRLSVLMVTPIITFSTGRRSSERATLLVPDAARGAESEVATAVFSDHRPRLDLPVGTPAPGRCPEGKTLVHAEITFSKGAFQTFGEQKHSCEQDENGASIKIEDRRGDYAMCCVELDQPLVVSTYLSTKPFLEVRSPEPKVEVKLEEGSRQIFLLNGSVEKNTDKLGYRSFRQNERDARPDRVCFAAVGNGPATNVVRLRAISLEKCQ